MTIHTAIRNTSLLLLLLALPLQVSADEYEKPVKRDYADAPPAPASQTSAEAEQKSAGCMSCHTDTDSKSMHASPAIQLGCTDCHGGDASVSIAAGIDRASAAYFEAQERAHVLPLYPESWHYPESSNQKRTYTLLNRESPEFIRFMNPSDFRVADQACGACHQQSHRDIEAQHARDGGNAVGRSVL